MSKFSENYSKVLEGHKKIVTCIDDSQDLSELEVVSRMYDSWKGLLEKYCEEVYYDRSDRRRKKNAKEMLEVIKDMCLDIRGRFEAKNEILIPEEYTGVNETYPIYDIQTISHM